MGVALENFISQSDFIKTFAVCSRRTGHKTGAETNVHSPNKEFWPHVLEWSPGALVKINFPIDYTSPSKYTHDNMTLLKNCRKQLKKFKL